MLITKVVILDLRYLNSVKTQLKLANSSPSRQVKVSVFPHSNYIGKIYPATQGEDSGSGRQKSVSNERQ